MAKPINKTPQQKAEATRKILAALRSGSTVEAACSFARTSRQTWYAWLKKDPDLRADYEEALAHSEISLVKVIKEDKSWQSKAWLLERRFPDRWAKRDLVIEEGSAGEVRGILCIPVRAKDK